MARRRTARGDEMAARVARGEKLWTIAADYGVSAAAVHGVAKTRGVFSPRAPGAERSERCDEMAARVAAGETVLEVALKYGVSGVAVWKAAQRRGVQCVRGPGRRPRTETGQHKEKSDDLER